MGEKNQECTFLVHGGDFSEIHAASIFGHIRLMEPCRFFSTHDGSTT